MNDAAAAIEELRQMLHGPVLTRDDAAYDDARAIWNAMIDKRPLAIVRCTGTADVIQAVRFAREHELLVSIRGGGHNVAGLALCDDGLLIDLSLMKGVHVDTQRRIVRAQPGARLGDLDHETQAFGLAVSAGIVTTTGIAGLTLGGGFGWITPKYGLTVDNLLSADVVTAEGELVKASPNDNPDLFWGIRGGGGNFGIVTSFEYQAHPVGPTVYSGVIAHPMEKAREVLSLVRDILVDAPEELTVIPALRIAPPSPLLPQELDGKPVILVFACYIGPLEQGDQVLSRLRDYGAPAADTLGPHLFTDHQSVFDATQPAGRNYYWKSEDLPPLTDPAIDTIVAHSENITSPHSVVALFQLGGAAGRVPEDACAYSHRNARHAININASWTDEDSDKHIAWARDFDTAMQSYTLGVYVNFLSNEGQDRVKAAYGPKKYDRLVALKRKYDPTNFFRVNQNIQP